MRLKQFALFVVESGGLCACAGGLALRDFGERVDVLPDGGSDAGAFLVRKLENGVVVFDGGFDGVDAVMWLPADAGFVAAADEVVVLAAPAAGPGEEERSTSAGICCASAARSAKPVATRRRPTSDGRRWSSATSSSGDSTGSTDDSPTARPRASSFSGRTAWARSVQTSLREFLRTETASAQQTAVSVSGPFRICQTPSPGKGVSSGVSLVPSSGLERETPYHGSCAATGRKPGNRFQLFELVSVAGFTCVRLPPVCDRSPPFDKHRDCGTRAFG